MLLANFENKDALIEREALASGGVCVGLGEWLALPAEVPDPSAQVSTASSSHTWAWGESGSAQRSPGVLMLFAICVYFPENIADKSGE